MVESTDFFGHHLSRNAVTDVRPIGEQSPDDSNASETAPLRFPPDFKTTPTYSAVRQAGRCVLTVPACKLRPSSIRGSEPKVQLSPTPPTTPNNPSNCWRRVTFSSIAVFFFSLSVVSTTDRRNRDSVRAFLAMVVILAQIVHFGDPSRI